MKEAAEAAAAAGVGRLHAAAAMLRRKLGLQLDMPLQLAVVSSGGGDGGGWFGVAAGREERRVRLLLLQEWQSW